MDMYRRRCWDIQQVVCTEYVTKYHQNTDGVNRGNQLMEHGYDFYSKKNFTIGANVVNWFCVTLVY